MTSGTHDIHNTERMLKGKITHYLHHSSGLIVAMMHEREALDCTLPIIQDMRVGLVIELGTSKGGFTRLLCDACPGAEIHSFDIQQIDPRSLKFFPDEVVFYTHDILKSGPAQSLVRALLMRETTKLLYCDNGRKKEEVALFHRYLNPGDYIGVHDWGREIFWKDIEPYIGNWEKVGWPLVEQYGALSRFWRKQ